MGDFDQKNNQEENFAELFEAYEKRLDNEVRVGEKIKVKVISIGRDTVFVDTGTRAEGVVDRKDLINDQGELQCKVDDALELFVVSLAHNEVRLARTLKNRGGDASVLADAYRAHLPVEGRVKEQCKGGFHVEIFHKRAFCPISQIDLYPSDDKDQYIGQTYQFQITQYDERGRNIVVSRRRFLEVEKDKAKVRVMERIANGQNVFEGRVTRLAPFGAFVEIDLGIEGMIHISELSWSRVEKPDEVVGIGQTVRVKAISAEEVGDNLKVGLSLKALAEEPWQQVSSRFNVGDLVSGKVKKCAKFGAFVELMPGIEGLIPLSEMSYTARVAKAEDVVRPGEIVSVMIKDIKADDKRMTLSLRDAEGDPWAQVPQRYAPGTRVEGRVEKKEKFGFLVNLEPGITGLIPRSELNNAFEPEAFEKMKAGDPVGVIVMSFDLAARKISLSVGDASADQEWQSYDQRSNSQSSMGTLGEKLKLALDSKKK